MVQKRNLQRLADQFRKELHVSHFGGNAVPVSVRIIFDADDCGLAADPALLAAGELRRQDQNHFNIVSLADRKVGVKKYAIRTQIARLPSGLKICVSRSDRDRDLHGNPFPGTPLDLVIGHRRRVPQVSGLLVQLRNDQPRRTRRCTKETVSPALAELARYTRPDSCTLGNDGKPYNSAMPIPTVIRGKKYLSLATFRRTGAAVRTPVWFAEENDKLYVMTRDDSGKYKRIRNNSEVRIAPCTVRGKITGPEFAGSARILPREAWPPARAAMRRKYWMARLPFWSKRNIYLEIEIAG